MKTRYKVGKLDRTIHVHPGDEFRLSHTEEYKNGDKTVILHTEEITKRMTCTHYAVLSTPFSMGMIIGTAKLGDWLEATFPGCGVGENEPIL
jgi:hypothetical protein